MRCAAISCLLVVLTALAAFGADLPPNVTSYRQLTSILAADSHASPLIQVASIGQSAKRQSQIWIARAADPSVSPAQTTRILIICRQHGDEPAPTEAAIKLLHGIAYREDEALLKDLRNVTLYVVPMANPDGADAMTRCNGSGADLNRDWGIFSQPETAAIARAARAIRPQIIIDEHNWDGDDPYDANCIEAPRMSNSALFRAEHNTQHRMASTLAASGYQVYQTTYGEGIDQHLAHRYFTAHGILSLLVETHAGSPTDRADFQRRQGFYLALIHSLANRFGQGSTDQRLALNKIENHWLEPYAEGNLFAARPTRSPVKEARASHASPMWLWVLCAYFAAMWLTRVGGSVGRPTRETESGMQHAPRFAPASERPSGDRRDTPRYRY